LNREARFEMSSAVILDPRGVLLLLEDEIFDAVA
jgi:hypothetical protein